MSDHVRVVIADDHQIVREGLRLILEAEDGLDVVAEAEDGEAAVSLALQFEPDVMLMDVRMPKLGGIEAITQIRERAPGVEIVILTTYDEDDVMVQGLRAGAKGYLLKDTGRETLIRTLRAAARGESLLTPDVLERLLVAAPPKRTAPPYPSVRLTGREVEILEAVVEGGRSREIAGRFGITERTVKAHLARIYGKLGVESRAAAVAKAIRKGLVPGDGS